MFNKHVVRNELEELIIEEGEKLRKKYHDIKRWLLNQVDSKKEENVIEIRPSKITNDPIVAMVIKHFVLFVESEGFKADVQYQEDELGVWIVVIIIRKND